MEEPIPMPTQPGPATKMPENPKKKSGALNKWLSIALSVLLVASLGVSAWYWQTAEAEKKRLNDEILHLQTQLDEIKAEAQQKQANAGDSTEPANCVDLSLMKENIKAALDSKNTAAFATYTLDPVNYVLAASEFGGDISPTEAASSLEYTHSATGPWDFNLPSTTVDAWKAGFYKDHFDDATRYIGKAASGMVVSFDFACNGKIQNIFVAADEGILL